MIEDYEKSQRRQLNLRRSIADYGMGVVFLFFGVYFLIYEKFGWNIFNRAPSSIDYLIGGMFLLYGFWRIYRGYKKNYFK